MSVERSLTNGCCRHEAAARAAELAELVLAKKRRRHKAAELATMSAKRSLANARPMVLWHQKTWQLLKNMVVTRQLLASTSPRRQQSHLPTSTWHSRAFGQHVNPSLLLSMPSPADIKAIVHNAPALPKITSSKPPAMLSPSPRPTSSYLGAVLNTNGGGHASLAPPSPTKSAPPSPTVVKGQLLRVRQCAQPRCCTGQRNHP
jgi:hypothetical protein